MTTTSRPTGAVGDDVDLPAGVADLLPAFLARQRWYAGDGEPHDIEVLRVRTLPVEAGDRLLWWVVAGAGDDRYQLLVGSRPVTGAADILGQERALLGVVDDRCYYDAVVDAELSLPLLSLISGGAESAERVRPISAEQSNTSLVYDDRVIMKVFRRLMDGPNPDVEVTTALSSGGFEHVAGPVASWREGGTDYMFAQRFLAGGSEGWALALTSLRDFYGSSSDDPAEAGGDFAPEAERLGRMTARMHLVLAETYGVAPLGQAAWGDLLGDIAGRLRAELPSAEGRALERLRAVGEPGPSVRVHGDYHLGQVMRTDDGWFVLDFEGEPARDIEERTRPTSPLKDVTGMLRSLQYAARFALREHSGGSTPDAGPAAPEQRAVAWELHNRAAFLRGYHAERGIAALLPGEQDEQLVSDAFELDKALYELRYERAYRPDWVDIPLGAIGRLVGGETDGGATMAGANG